MVEYVFNLKTENDEVLFCFPQLPQIISALPNAKIRAMDNDSIQAHATGAVLTALTALRNAGKPLPAGDSAYAEMAHGVVSISNLQLIKLEVNAEAQSFPTLAAFARSTKFRETTARRLVDLDHASLL